MHVTQRPIDFLIAICQDNSEPEVIASTDLTETGEDISREESEAPAATIIIEELDTPATRREKNMRKKAERLLRATDTDDAPAAGPSTSQPGTHAFSEAGPTDIDGDIEMDANSDLTSLSSEDDWVDAGPDADTVQSAHTGEEGAARVHEQDRGKVVLKGGKLLEEGTLGMTQLITFSADI